jgi:phosphoribosyl 1,2-cyclic phosphate phosphodiesterase
VLISYNNHNVVIDTGPDFHAQAIRAGIRRLDAVFYTHGHADHILGMDDLRPLTFHSPRPLPLYADAPTAATIERIFDYTFPSDSDPDARYPTSARVALHRLDPTPGAAVQLFGASFQRIPVAHGRQTITGYRFGSAAYLTDLSGIPAESLPLLSDLDISRPAQASPRLLHPHVPRPRPRSHQRRSPTPHPSRLRRPPTHLQHRPRHSGRRTQIIALKVYEASF